MPALLTGVVAEYVIIGTGRAQLGYPTEGRYLYVAAPAILITVAILLARIQRRGLALAIATCLLDLSLIGNVREFGPVHDALAATLACETAGTCPKP